MVVQSLHSVVEVIEHLLVGILDAQHPDGDRMRDSLNLLLHEGSQLLQILPKKTDCDEQPEQKRDHH